MAETASGASSAILSSADLGPKLKMNQTLQELPSPEKLEPHVFPPLPLPPLPPPQSGKLVRLFPSVFLGWAWKIEPELRCLRFGGRG